MLKQQNQLFSIERYHDICQGFPIPWTKLRTMVKKAVKRLYPGIILCVVKLVNELFAFFEYY